MDNEQGNAPGLDDLDRIALEAKGREDEAQAQQDEILNPTPDIDPAEAWAALPKMFGSLLQIAMPELAGVYTDKACLMWGGAMNEVAKKHNWDATATMSRWAPEIGLIFASVPLIIPTVHAIRVRREEAQAKEKTVEVQELQPATMEPAASGAQGGNFVDPD